MSLMSLSLMSCMSRMYPMSLMSLMSQFSNVLSVLNVVKCSNLQFPESLKYLRCLECWECLKYFKMFLESQTSLTYSMSCWFKMSQMSRGFLNLNILYWGTYVWKCTPTSIDNCRHFIFEFLYCICNYVPWLVTSKGFKYLKCLKRLECSKCFHVASFLMCWISPRSWMFQISNFHNVSIVSIF